MKRASAPSRAAVPAAVTSVPMRPVSLGVAGRLTLGGLKLAVDLLDAIVSAWIGLAALAGVAEPLGEDASAIWVPVADLSVQTAKRAPAV
jgi:hypothetical protein